MTSIRDTHPLLTPLERVKGVGSARAELLARLQLQCVRDLLFLFPRDYADLSDFRSIDDLEPDEPVSVLGEVEEVELREFGEGKSLLGLLLVQSTGDPPVRRYLRAVWFNQPFLTSKFQAGQRVVLSGKAKLHANRWEMRHPRVQILGPDEQAAAEVLPVYPLTEGLTQNMMRRLMRAVTSEYVEHLDEVFPDDFRRDYDLPGIQEAVLAMHQPSSLDQVARARRRFVIQELLVLQLALGLRRWELTHDRQAPQLPADARIDARILRLFPFELTGDQRQVMREVGLDMGRGIPMNRMLQGDVGSGKTVVAEYAMLLAVAHGHQAVMMAPTELLAQQHYRTLARNLRKSRVRLALLTGSLSARERREVFQTVAEGEVDVLVGTHAIGQAVAGEKLQFAKLGLVVIDEQHKFGVQQRAWLKQAALQPHYLVMTATPIPRTLTMSLFGDLDCSILREKPAGRPPVHTYEGTAENRDRWWEFFRKKLREGRQAYVVAPLVESDSDDIASVEALFEELAAERLEEFRIGLVHGRMSGPQKEAAMKKFRDGDSQVLVATSVIEVGVDVPNATLMTIESGERFGLAQLHQLRGRVSRGTHAGYVCVFASAETDEAHRRLAAFCDSNDGFELAEMDFHMRGPGDLFGVRQHGLPPLRIADLQRDAELLEEARLVAKRLLEEDPQLLAPHHERLRRMVLVRYGEALELADVG